MTSGSASNFIRSGLLTLGLLIFLLDPCRAEQGTASPERGAPGAVKGTFISSKILSVEIDPPDPSSQKLLQETGVAPGQPYTPLVIKKGVEALYKTGAFRDIRVEGNPGRGGTALKFLLSYRQMLSGLELRGNHVIGDDPLLQAIQGSGLRVGSELTDTLLAQALLEVSRLYQDAGYFRVRAVPRLRPGRDPHTVRLEISISEGERTKIGRVRFTGDRVLSDWTLYGCPWCFSSRSGEYYSRARLEKDIQHLLSLYQEKGFLKATVAPPKVTYQSRTNEVEITLEITASNRILLRFEGIAPLGRYIFPPSSRELRNEREDVEQQLRNLVPIREEQSDDEGVLEEGARRIELLYKDNGYPFAKVGFRRQEQPSERLTEITFLINAGPHVRIRQIRFEGNHGVPAKQLRSALSLEAGDVFVEARLPGEVERLIGFYRAEGFLKASAQVSPAWSAKKDRVDLLFLIKEGPQTRISKIVFNGLSVFAENALRPQLQTKEGAPFNEARLKEDRRLLLNRYSRLGYLHANVEPSVQISEDGRQATVTYRVMEGPQIRVGKIILEGNAMTRGHILRRELLIHTNDPLDLERVLDSQKRLYRLGLFSEVRFEPRPTSDPLVQDMLLSVKERPTTALEFGIGYADYDRLRGYAQVSKINLFGTGRSISLRAEGSRIEQLYTLSYKEPWIFSRDMDGRLGLEYDHTRQVSYILDTTSLSVGLDKTFTDSLKGILLYQYEHDVIRNVDPAVSPQISPEDRGRFNIATINPSLTFDTRDNPFNPSRGVYIDLTFRDAAKLLGSEKQFVKETAQISEFLTLNPKLVLALSARGGAAREFGESTEVPLSERFLAGGRNTVRGYDQDKLGIRNVTIVDGKPTGGNALLVFNEELRLSLPFSVGLVFFFDHGNVWPTLGTVRIDQIKSTTGTGIRYNTPVGPLRLDYGYKLNREEGESPWALHFTLGHAF